MLLSGNCVIHIFFICKHIELISTGQWKGGKRNFLSSVSFIFLNQINVVNYKGCPHLTRCKSKKNSCGPQPLTKFKPDILQRNQGPHLLMLKCTTVANELKETDVERTYWTKIQLKSLRLPNLGSKRHLEKLENLPLSSSSVLGEGGIPEWESFWADT